MEGLRLKFMQVERYQSRYCLVITHVLFVDFRTLFSEQYQERINDRVYIFIEFRFEDSTFLSLMSDCVANQIIQVKISSSLSF